jgi:hypothetical protein
MNAPIMPPKTAPFAVRVCPLLGSGPGLQAVSPTADAKVSAITERVVIFCL